eukprot:Colp12_sorted_trinity150504_noHs@14737
MPASTMKKYTAKELAESPNLFAIEGTVYDMTEFKNKHPGGDIIQFYGGHDVSAAYYMLHTTHFKPHPTLSKYSVGTLEGTSPEDIYDYHSPFYTELRQKVNEKLKEIGTNGFYAPWWFHLRTAFLIFTVLSLDYSWIVHGPSYLKAFLLGLNFAYIGLNIQHDANHGAISRKAWINKVLGYTQDYIGGSRMLWVRQHLVGHHVHCSHESLDPDVGSGKDLLVLHEKFADNAQWYHTYQHVYVWPLLQLLGINWLIMDIRNIYRMKVGGRFSINSALTREKEISLFFRVLHIFRYLIIGLYHTGSLITTINHIFVMSAVAGAYLGLFFIISHNFNEATRLDVTAKRPCWAKNQVESSSNVGGFGLLVMHGGLNYQIEHHLFPRVSSARYHYIAPTVKAVCEKHGVKYQHFPTVTANLKSTVAFLYNMGRGYFKKNL